MPAPALGTGRAPTNGASVVLHSLWEARHPAQVSTIEAGGASVEGTWDTVVVGGGITGLVTALLLARSGQDVLVVEAHTVGSGTTGRSTAKVSTLQGTRLQSIARQHSREVVERYATANTEALAWLMRYADEHQVATQQRTAYTFATTEAGEASARAEHEVARTAGLPTRWLDATTLPFATRGAVALDEQAQLDPLELVGALADDVRRHGGTIVEHTRVEAVEGQDPIRVVTASGDAIANRVVLATNMPVLDRGGFFARATPARSYAVAFATDEPAVDGMYLSADSPSRSLRDAPDDGSGPVLLIGGNGHTTGRSASPREKIADLMAWTAEHFPGAEPLQAWSAQDYLPAGALPWAGPLTPGRDDLLVAGAFAKWGFTNGVAAALALSGRILGGHITWADVFDPWSARKLRGIPSAAAINATVGVEMARGWIRPLAGTASRGARRSQLADGDGTVCFDHVGGPTGTSRVDGAEHRVSAVCPHLGGVLRWNDAELSWDCPLHGSRFAADGTLLEGPATSGLTRRA